MKRLHILLTSLSLTLILLSINRLGGWTYFTLQPYDFLRLIDFNQMLIIPILTVIIYWLLRDSVIGESKGKPAASWITLAHIVLLIGIYCYGVGNGTHDLSNHLHHTFCGNQEVTPTCAAIAFNDDQFSNTVYYIGLTLLTIALIWIERLYPRSAKVSANDILLISLNGLFIALAIFANLSRHGNLLHSTAFAIIAGTTLLFALPVIGKIKHYPLTYYFAFSYTVGTVATLVYKLLS